jgi:hypothetical protein
MDHEVDSRDDVALRVELGQVELDELDARRGVPGACPHDAAYRRAAFAIAADEVGA